MKYHAAGVAAAITILNGLGVGQAGAETIATLTKGQSNPIVLFGGILLLVVAVLTNAFAYSGYIDAGQIAGSYFPAPAIESRHLGSR